ncbi:MAG: hypothetical protein EA341_11115 [Mongoliibacter sp.]|uniref:hypothetical protein n=1 Tax=Mongoliibacter sp. TaxID=2022438 RepID=UPI0012F052CA|nr:hypothetical protein [Mongoliibacter sp.]TVP48268.1 MAG: hypothetical protein EA341_11115 [Mongoliibacter sp.]
MTRLIPLIIKEQKIIQLSQLTIDQANDLRSWLPDGSIRKMEFQGMELNDCVAFETYSYWYRTFHILSRNHETILDF